MACVRFQMQEERLQEARKEYKQLVENKAKKELEAQSSAEAKATAPPPIDDLVGTPCSPWHNLRHSTAACAIRHAACRACLPPPPEPLGSHSSTHSACDYPMHEPHKRSAPGGRSQAAGPVWLATLLRIACSE